MSFFVVLFAVEKCSYLVRIAGSIFFFFFLTQCPAPASVPPIYFPIWLKLRSRFFAAYPTPDITPAHQSQAPPALISSTVLTLLATERCARRCRWRVPLEIGGPFSPKKSHQRCRYLSPLAAALTPGPGVMNSFSFTVVSNLPTSPASLPDGELSFFTAEFFTLSALLLQPPIQHSPVDQLRLKTYSRSLRI